MWFLAVETRSPGHFPAESCVTIIQRPHNLFARWLLMRHWNRDSAWSRAFKVILTNAKETRCWLDDVARLLHGKATSENLVQLDDGYKQSESNHLSWPFNSIQFWCNDLLPLCLHLISKDDLRVRLRMFTLLPNRGSKFSHPLLSRFRIPIRPHKSRKLIRNALVLSFHYADPHRARPLYDPHGEPAQTQEIGSTLRIYECPQDRCHT